MNILFISSQPFPFGMAGSKRIRLFAEYLAINHNVKVIVAGYNNDRNNDSGVYNGVIWEFIRFYRLQLLFSWIKIKLLLKRNYESNTQNITILIDSIGLTNVLFAIISRNLGYSVFTDIVEDYGLTNEMESNARRLLLLFNNFFDKRINYFIDGIYVISKRLYDKYLKLGVDFNSILLIPISAENLFLDLIKNNLSENYKFVYSGSYGVKDGVDILIKAFKELSKFHSSIELVLSGKINDSIYNLINDTPQIKYIGLVPDDEYYQFLKNADVLLMTRIDSPYANTGFPFKLGEYLATGNPVIATDVSDINLYLEDKKDVIFAKPSDELSLMNSIKFVIENKEEATRIGVNGYKRCMTFFNPLTNGQQLETFLVKKLNHL